MALFTDTFTGTAGDKLTVRSGWTKHGSGINTDAPEINASNQLRASTLASDVAMIGQVQSSVDHYAQATCLSGFPYSGSGSRTLVCVRSIDRNDYWGVSYNTADGRWELMRAGTGAGRHQTYLAAFTSGDVVRIEAESNVLRVYINGTLRMTLTSVIYGLTNVNTGVLIRGNPAADPVLDNWETNELAAGDTTAPVLTLPTGVATGSTTGTGTVVTDEANGTLYRLASTNATETAATVVGAGLSQAVTTTGVQNVSFTGLTASTVYYAHYVHDDAALNRSARVSSTSFTTDTPDTTAPTLSSPTATALSNALIAAGVTTNEANGTLYVVATTSATPPTATQIRAGQNNAGTAAVFAGNQAISSTGVKTFNVTGLNQLTLYYLYFHHQDAAGNNSTVSSSSATTFRNGATGQFIIDNTGPVGANPAGILYNDVVLPGDADKWFSFLITTPPADAGSLTIDAQGRFTWVSMSADSFYYQLEVDGANVGSPQLVTLDPTPSNATKRTPNGMIGFWNR